MAKSHGVVRRHVGTDSIGFRYSGLFWYLAMGVVMFNKNQIQNISITSNNQSGGITAHTVNTGATRRQLDAASAQQLLKALPKNKPVKVVAVMGDQEAFAYATQILGHLKANDYLAEGVDQAVYSQPVVGQFINPTASGFEVLIGGQ
jgi:hypothetical protein